MIFKELATNEYLAELKAEAEKYTGLYVDMNNAPERKYVKDKADTIKQLLKKLDRARIDTAKNYKAAVEKEAASIKEQLEIANTPFTLLIDEWQAERKRILDAEKAEKAVREAVAQKELDHEEAIMMNRLWDLEEEKRETEKEEARIAQEKMIKEREKLAAERARQDEIARQEQQKQAELAEKAAREADQSHKKSINNAALESLMIKCALSDDQAKSVVIAVAKGEISNVTITY